MEIIDVKKMSKINRILRPIDYFAFAALMVFLVINVISFGLANIQTDSIDYYAILQRLTHSSGNPIVRNLHFVKQRSPGYPVLALIPYYLISSCVEPFVQTEKIGSPSNPPAFPVQAPTERMLLPDRPILFRDIFFKDFYIQSQDSWFEWKLIVSLLFTGYALLFIGLIFAVKSLALQNKPWLGASLVPLVVITSPVFMHNIVKTPAYATLTAFGLSCLFTYFFVKGFLEKRLAPQFLSGLFAGLLVLTRLETIVIAAVVFVALVILRDSRFLKNYVLGGFLPAIILLFYNLSQYGNPFHLGILAGDINLISLDWGYLSANLFNPQSGILFWSTLPSLGIIGLFLDDKQYTEILGIGSLALIAVVLVRMPIMVNCVGEGTRLIGGLPLTCPNNLAEALILIRFDINRYIVVLIPFSILGLQTLLASIPGQLLAIQRALHTIRKAV